MEWQEDRHLDSPRLSVAFATCCIIDLFGVFPIIALPRPIIDCGWLGIPLAFAVFGIQVYTAILLGRCWNIAERVSPSIRKKSRYPYPAIAELALGEKPGKFVAIILDITVYGAGIPNLIIAAQNMQIIALKITESQVDFSYCYWLIILGVLLCPIMWLGSPKDMKWLALLSVFTVFTVSFLTWNCIIQDPRTELPVRKEVSWENVAIAYGILAFQFDIHPTILSVQIDMEKRNELAQPILIAFLVTGSLFTITTGLAEHKYGSSSYFNILQGLPGSSALYLDISLVSMQIFLSMVIGTSAFFQDVEDKLGIPTAFNYKRCILRSAFVMLLVVIGEAVPRFDLIMGLIGGCLTGPLMFIMPPILYYKLNQLQLQQFYTKHQERNCQCLTECSGLITSLPSTSFQCTDQRGILDRRYRDIMPLHEIVFCVFVLLVGVTATFLATYFSVRNTVLYAELTPSCVMNFTAASHLLDLST